MSKRKRHVRLVDTVDNKRHKRSGYTLPGYNYLGPGNDLNNGIPTNRDDAIAADHDFDYADIINKGDNPYFSFSQADQTAIDNFGSSFGGQAGKLFFRGKKLAAKAGLIPTLHHKKRHHFAHKKQSDPRHHFIEQVAKKPKEDPKKPDVPFGIRPKDIVTSKNQRLADAKKKVEEAKKYMQEHPFDARAYRAYVNAENDYKTIQSGGETEAEALKNAQTNKEQANTSGGITF